MKTNRVLGFSAALAVSLSACQQYDITQNFSESTKYADQFIEVFGQPDPLQDWGMVTMVTMTVKVGDAEGKPNGRITVYTTDPYDPNSKVLASKVIEDNEISLTFEASSHSNFLYVGYLRENGYVQYKSVQIEDGKGVAYFDFMEEEESEEASTRARVSTDTQATEAVDYWNGEVPAGQYDPVIPADAVVVSGTLGEINSYTYQGVNNLLLHNATIASLNMYAGNVNLYVTGRTVISTWFCAGNTNIYVTPGSTLIIENTSSFAQPNTTWTICENSRLSFSNNVEFSRYQTVYNKGRIEATQLTLSCDDSNGRSILYNDGTLNIRGMVKPANELTTFLINRGNVTCTELPIVGRVFNEGEMTVKGQIDVTTGTAVLYNRGWLEGRGLTTAGSSTFINDYNGTTDITGPSLVNSNDCTWRNSGHYTTTSMTFNSTSGNWLNECYLTVINKLEIRLGGNPKIPVNNSYIEAGSMYMDNGGMKLGSNSQLVVNGTANFGWNPYNEWNRSCGLQSTASGNSWAVFKAGSVTSSGYISYVGNLLVDCEDHVSAGQWGSPTITFAGNAKLAPGGDNYSIPGSDCNEPYESSVPARPTDMPMTWIMACEDLGGTNDYDFNDVIFSISHLSGEKSVQVTPLAAGGSLASVVYYKNQPVRGDVTSSEIHHWLNCMEFTVSGKYPMINTSRGHSSDYTGETVSVELDDPEASLNDIARLFDVRVIAKDGDVTTGDYKVARIVTRPDGGAMPQIILVPNSWIWPIEKISIKSAYPGFQNWVQDVTITDWASSAVNTNLVKNY